MRRSGRNKNTGSSWLRVGLAVPACLVIAAGLGVGSTEAQAFGDQCFNPLRVEGQDRSSMRAAMASARHQWERVVTQRQGGRYADWYYSGDRSMDCTWDRSGTVIRCTTTATPCGPKR